MTRFYSDFGKEIPISKLLDPSKHNINWVGYIYLPYSEYDEMRQFLLERNRDLRDVSLSGIYAVYNMCFVPIEDRIKHYKTEENQAKEKRKALEAIHGIIRANEVSE